MMFIDCRNDDEIRLSRLILATLNAKWALLPHNDTNDTMRYIKRADHAGKSIDKHQVKDTSCNHQILFPIAPTGFKEI